LSIPRAEACFATLGPLALSLSKGDPASSARPPIRGWEHEVDDADSCLFSWTSFAADDPPSRGRAAQRYRISDVKPDASPEQSQNCRHFFDTLGEFSTVRAIKLYRLHLDDAPPVPVLPCLDHEAMLHGEVAPHAAAYVEDGSGSLHEIVYVPRERRIRVDTVSTMFERSPDAHDRLVTTLERRFPGHTIEVDGPSWIRGDLRVAKACHAQAPLRDVLTGADLERTTAAVERLQTISSLMEKESRVASWGARTVMTPLVAVAGFLSYQILGALEPRIGSWWVASLRYSIVGVVGAYFLYYGLKAIQLTEMGNRVWKRSAEYQLILSERRRLGK
jgi:hypothetical protein